MTQPAWRLLAAAGSFAIVAHLVLPEPWRSAAYEVPRVLALGACVVAARSQPERRRLWSLVAAALAWFLFGSLLDVALPATHAPSDVVFVSGYLLLGAAVAAIPVAATAELVGAALDAALVTAAAAVFVFLFWLEPLAADTGGGLFARAASGVYPVVDLLLLALLVTMLLRTSGPWLLVASMLALLVSDLAYSWLLAQGRSETNAVVDAGWMASYAILGVAALVPGRDTRLALPPGVASWRRLALVGACLFAVPLAATIQLSAGGAHVHQGALVAFGSVIAALSCVRLAAIARERHRSEQHFRALIETTNDVVLIVDEDATLLYVGPSVYRMLGRPAEDYLGRNGLELVHPDDRDATAEATARAFAGDPSEVVYRIADAAGDYRTFAATGRPIVRGPYTGAVLVNARDITQRLAIEAELAAKDEQLRHAQKLEAVGQLAGGVAHDFNNLLTAICGYGELAQEEAVALARPELEANIGEVLKAATRAGALTRELLAFARSQRLQPQRLDMSETLRSLDRLLRHMLGADVELVTVLDDAACWVEADPGQLEQVMLNLVVNARDAMPDGGTLTLALRGDADTVTLTVADTGCGMDPETRRRAFEPFFTTKPIGKGTGLGLATVYGIVAQSGGEISVSSELGVGTAFSVRMPRVTPPEGGHGDPERREDGAAGIVRHAG